MSGEGSDVDERFGVEGAYFHNHRLYHVDDTQQM
jgi:hypothetical protein